MIDYFAYYGLPRQLNLDTTKLRKLFYQKSMKVHPDHNGKDDLESAALNNEAFQTLQAPMTRVQHLLALEGVLDAEEKHQMRPTFLMEMMEFNEALMDEEKAAIQLDQIRTIQADYMDEMLALGSDWEALSDQDRSSRLAQIKERYFELRYLNRLINQNTEM